MRRPYFTRSDGTVRHWPRYDFIRRSRNMALMFLVVDRPEDERYEVLRFDAGDPTGRPEEEARFPYIAVDGSDLYAYHQACEHATQLAEEASRARVHATTGGTP